jgi:hypothetical protein
VRFQPPSPSSAELPVSESTGFGTLSQGRRPNCADRQFSVCGLGRQRPTGIPASGPGRAGRCQAALRARAGHPGAGAGARARLTVESSRALKESPPSWTSRIASPRAASKVESYRPPYARSVTSGEHIEPDDFAGPYATRIRAWATAENHPLSAVRCRDLPDQRYEAGRLTIGALLSTTSPRIEVPEWQRSYSWTTEEIEAFWQDLIAFDARYPDDNILGEEYFLGSIVLVTGGSTNLLLDGQQRLATATILLSVLRNARRQYSGDAATRLQNKYISDFDDATNTTTHVLTLNVYDRDFFRSEIQDEPQNPPVWMKPTLKSHGLVRKAREFFARRVAEECEKVGGGEPAFQRNLRIGRVLCDQMSVVAVSSTDEDNAAAVFETLNDRGIGLSTPDLLRNLLLRRAPDDATRGRVVAAWQTVLAINEEASVEEFLRHFWVSHRGDVKARKLYREIKDKITAENIGSLPLSLELAEAAPVYRDIVRAREDDPELRRLLEGIRALGAKALYPALLSGYAVAKGEEGKEGLRLLSSALTTMFVRYNVVGGRETTVMETTIYEAAASLRKTKDFDAAVAAVAALAPDAEDFVTRFQRASVSRITTARYLLVEIEHAKRQTQEVGVEGTDRVHVEHIYPQTPDGPRWPNHAQVINRLGNLTLLGKRLNTTIKNADFPTKKKEGYAASDILMTKELLPVNTWDTAAIDERQGELSQWVFDIWKFPGETPPAKMPEPTAEAVVGDAQKADDDEAAVLDQLPEVPA